MIIKINNLEWNVFFVPRDHNKLEADGVQCLGKAYFDDLHIYLDKSVSEELMRQTVIHELVHAFLFSYGVHVECNDDYDTEEAVCDFCGAYFDKIKKAANKIIKAWCSER